MIMICSKKNINYPLLAETHPNPPTRTPAPTNPNPPITTHTHPPTHPNPPKPTHNHPPGSFRAVSGLFGSFQKGETTLDDREDYMETKPSQPQTTDNQGISGSSPIDLELSSIRTTKNDPETTGNGRKYYMETIEDDPKQPDTTQNRPTMHFSSQCAVREVYFSKWRPPSRK